MSRFVTLWGFYPFSPCPDRNKADQGQFVPLPVCSAELFKFSSTKLTLGVASADLVGSNLASFVFDDGALQKLINRIGS